MACCFIFIIAVFAGILNADDKKPLTKLPTNLRGEITKLIYDFKREKDPIKRADYARRIFAPGAASARFFREALEKDGAKALRDYIKLLNKASESVFKKRLKKKEWGEIKKLQEKVTALRKIKELAKDEIFDIGDPAMERLREMMMTPIETIISSSDKLKKVQDQLEIISEYVIRCNIILEEENVEPKWDLERIKQRAQAIPLFSNNKQIKVFENNQKLAEKIGILEADGILDLNVMRLMLGLGALTIDVKLCDAARDHSNDMRTIGFFAHESPVPGKKTPWDRASRFGTSCKSENIYCGGDSPYQANISWFHSPGHHKNMLNPGLKIMGLGRSELFWTQMFR